MSVEAAAAARARKVASMTAQERLEVFAHPKLTREIVLIILHRKAMELRGIWHEANLIEVRSGKRGAHEFRRI